MIASVVHTPRLEATPLKLLSVVLPARDEEGCIEATLRHLHLELSLNAIPHEIIPVDDGSTDSTWEILRRLQAEIPEIRPIQNPAPHGFGHAIIKGLDSMTGDAATIMMADESDDARDVVRYWTLLNEGFDCVFGSRFMKGGGVIDYPWFKLKINRLANLFIRLIFNIKLNDTTNAFKAYRKTVIDGCRPFLSPHFNLTVELPLKAIVRGFTWTTMPITWKNRRTGVAKLKIKEMGSRYFFIVAYVWLEKYFSRGDYKNQPLK
jgi:dolichol-phosphate mannosyltransferase